jgi:hypothetical protein
MKTKTLIEYEDLNDVMMEACEPADTATGPTFQLYPAGDRVTINARSHTPEALAVKCDIQVLWLVFVLAIQQHGPDMRRFEIIT